MTVAQKIAKSKICTTAIRTNMGSQNAQSAETEYLTITKPVMTETSPMATAAALLVGSS